MLQWVLPQVPGKYLQQSHVAVPAPDLPPGWWPLYIFQGGAPQPPLCLVFQWEASISEVEEFQGTAAALLG